jgi:hypothetical protein
MKTYLLISTLKMEVAGISKTLATVPTSTGYKGLRTELTATLNHCETLDSAVI